jgi:dTDP-glucose pyrophosphorylase
VTPPTLSKKSIVLDAVSAIESTYRRATVVVDETNKLIGTITDGDIRRFLLTGGNLNDLAINAMNSKPIYTFKGASLQDILSLMILNNVLVIPILDKDLKFLELFHVNDMNFATTSLRETHSPRTAVIMAGGEGKRLNPFTENTPKPMLEIGGIPLLHWQVNSLVSHGFTRIFLSVNYLAHVIEDYFKTGEQFGAEILYLRENYKSGTAGSLSLINQFKNEPILVINGDIFTDLDFESLWNYHKTEGKIITIAGIQYKIEIPYGVITLEEESTLKEIKEKPSQQFLCNAGVYVLSPDAIEIIPRDQEFNMPELIAKCISLGQKISVFPIYEHWSDVGSIKDLEQVRAQFILSKSKILKEF